MVYQTPHYNLVVFGAPGFIGRILCQYLLDQIGVNSAIKWAISSRSQAKCPALLN
ncbi:MAG: hypothetical protein AAGI69_19390 [Cyanobacteria bacterium P01_H01_bin.21]